MGGQIPLCLPRQDGEEPTLLSLELLQMSPGKTKACHGPWGSGPVLPCSSCSLAEGPQCPRSRVSSARAQRWAPRSECSREVPCVSPGCRGGSLAGGAELRGRRGAGLLSPCSTGRAGSSSRGTGPAAGAQHSSPEPCRAQGHAQLLGASALAFTYLQWAISPRTGPSTWPGPLCLASLHLLCACRAALPTPALPGPLSLHSGPAPPSPSLCL